VASRDIQWCSLSLTFLLAFQLLLKVSVICAGPRAPVSGESLSGPANHDDSAAPSKPLSDFSSFAPQQGAPIQLNKVAPSGDTLREPNTLSSNLKSTTAGVGSQITSATTPVRGPQIGNSSTVVEEVAPEVSGDEGTGGHTSGTEGEASRRVEVISRRREARAPKISAAASASQQLLNGSGVYHLLNL
jgi:hypothetical protein